MFSWCPAMQFHRPAQPIVYYQNERGYESVCFVETGLTANKQTEIISGLVEGESIIVD